MKNYLQSVGWKTYNYELWITITYYENIHTAQNNSIEDKFYKNSMVFFFAANEKSFQNLHCIWITNGLK